MPIKFRCTHCHQLLGISRTRATARVDCPRCGRSIRVPGADGDADTADSGSQERQSDGTLKKALGELLVLAAPESNAPKPSGDTSVKTPPHSSRDHGAISLEPLPADDPIVVELQPQAMTPNPRAVERQDPDRPTSHPLAELARTAQKQRNSQETSPQKEPTRRISSVMSLMLLVVALAVGWGLGALQNRSLQTLADHQPDRLREAPDPNGQPIAIDRQLTGRIEYQDIDGQLLADDGALILLLPHPRVGSLLLDARSFQKGPRHPDRLATEAALISLGGRTARCDSDGRFSLSAEYEGPQVLIAISHHLERPDDVAADPGTRDVISAWFNSCDHMIGRRRVEMTRIDESVGEESLNIQFQTQL